VCESERARERERERESNLVAIPQLWFVVRKLTMIIKGGQYSENNFNRKCIGKLLMPVFAYLRMMF